MADIPLYTASRRGPCQGYVTLVRPSDGAAYSAVTDPSTGVGVLAVEDTDGLWDVGVAVPHGDSTYLEQVELLPGQRLGYSTVGTPPGGGGAPVALVTAALSGDGLTATFSGAGVTVTDGGAAGRIQGV